MVTLTINGRAVTAPEDLSLLQAIRAAGFDVPALCALDGLPPYGACRLCLVLLTAPRHAIVASCAQPVEDGLVVETHAEEVIAVRRLALEFLLARCPESTQLRTLAAREGVAFSRFAMTQPAPSGELCVLCGLCVRVCRDLVGAGAIGFTGRGVDRAVSSPFGVQADACIGCGACAAVCPTGAVQIEDVDGQRVLRAWNTVVPLQPCRVCGRPYAPEPMAFLRQLVESCEHLWGVCPACRRRSAAAQLRLAP